MFHKGEKEMYLEEFMLPFEGKLNANNRWVKFSKLIPWAAIEERYVEHFPKNVAKKPNRYGWLSERYSSKRS